jgi:hypothetical protein
MKKMNVFQLLSRLHVQSGVEYFTWSDLSNLMKTCRALYTCFRPALHSMYIPYDVDTIVKTMARLEIHGWCVHVGWSVSSITLGRFAQGPTHAGSAMRVWWKRHANFTAEKCAFAM